MIGAVGALVAPVRPGVLREGRDNEKRTGGEHSADERETSNGPDRHG